MTEMESFLKMIRRCGIRHIVVEDYEADTTTVSLENQQVGDIRVDVEFRFSKVNGHLDRWRVREG